MSDERHFPPGVVPGAVGALGLVAAAVLVLGVVFGWLLGSCDHPEPAQMIQTPATAASSTAIATSSAQVRATQSVRVTVRRPSGYNESQRTPDASPSAKTAQVTRTTGGLSLGDPGEEITIEVSQAITAGATSSAQASESTSQSYPDPASFLETHGRLGIIAATMPGILAADVELAQVDVPPWLVGVDLEVGLDVAGNLEAGAVGVSAGRKAFVLVGGWSRWDLSQQGLAAAVGLRF